MCWLEEEWGTGHVQGHLPVSVYVMGGYLSVLLYSLQTVTVYESQMFLAGANVALFFFFFVLLIFFFTV